MTNSISNNGLGNFSWSLLAGLFLFTYLQSGFCKGKEWNESEQQVSIAEEPPSDPFMSWPDELKLLLMQQLAALGHSPELMAKEATVIKTLTDPQQRVQATIAFRRKYEAMAIQAMHQLAVKSPNPEAQTFILDVEKVWRSTEPNGEGEPPQNIALIYQDVFNLRGLAVWVIESACLTRMVKVTCIFALIVNKECRYYYSERAHPAPGVLDYTLREGLHTPRYSSRSEPFSGSFSPYGQSGSSYYEVTDWAHSTQTFYFHRIDSPNNGDDNFVAHAMGFTWPVQHGDYSMCVGFVQERSSVRGNAIYSRITVHTPLGYARANQRWWLALEGVGAPQLGVSGQTCGFAHPEAVTSTFADDAGSVVGLQAPGCWFRDLSALYERTRATQPYPIVAGDPDTYNAAAVDVVSHVEANQYYWGEDSIADTYFGFGFTGMEVLVIGDRH